MQSRYTFRLDNIASILDKLRGIRILVVGDVMMDEHIWADVERISPEAPVPVARVHNITRVGGGAANVAANVRGLEAAACLVGVIGKDEQGKQLCEWLKANDIDISGMIFAENRMTTIKTRIIARTQHLVRVDREDITPIVPEIEKQVQFAVMSHLASADGLLISDYAKGILTPRLCQGIIRKATSLGKPIIVDPKGTDYQKYTGATVLTPNEKEAEIASGILIRDEQSLEQAASEILRISNSRWLIITRGAQGITIFSKNYKRHVPAVPVEVFDVAGAGDTAVAVIASLLSSGIDIETSVHIANLASSVVIQKPGVVSINKSDLLAQVGIVNHSKNKSKIKTLKELEIIVQELKNKKIKVVFTNGCFDLLHLGHIRLLQEARKHGDVLIVGINSDRSVNKLKGEKRPITGERERAELLAALSMVDYVVIFDEDTPEEILKRLQVNVHVKGGDYSLDSLPEAKVVEAYGGSVVLFPYIDGYSTSDIISRIRDI